MQISLKNFGRSILGSYSLPTFFIAVFALFAGSATAFADSISFSAATLTVAPGAIQVLYVTLPPFEEAPAGGLTIQLFSTNSAVAQVPATITIPATSNGIGFYVTGGLAGTATIIGFNPSFATISTNVTVAAAPAQTLAFSTPSLTVPSGGGQQELFVVLSGPAPVGGVTVALQSSNTSSVQVPASVTIPFNTTGIGFFVTGLLPGSAMITGTASGFAPIVANVTVVPATGQTIAFSSSNLTIPVGGQQALFVTLSGPPAPAGGLTIALQSSNPLIAQVPASVTIPANTNGIGFFVTGLLAGSATITGTSAGFAPITANVTVTSPTAPPITFSASNLTVMSGTQGILYVTLPYLTEAPPGGLTITLSSSNPAVAQVPASITIPGNTNGIGFYVKGVAPGTAIITGSAPPSFGPITANVTVD